MFTKLVLSIILLAIGIAIVAACTQKSPATFVREIRKISRKVVPEDGTIALPTFFINQYGANGSVVSKHKVFRSDLYDDQGNLIGLQICHPSADDTSKPNTLALFGRREGKKLNTKDPDTYNAMTVPNHAFTIGEDEKGFYAEVTRAEAIVAIYEDSKLIKKCKFGEFFDIPLDSNLRILVGNQFLSFTTPGNPIIPNGRGATESGEEMGEIFGKRGIRPRNQS